MRERQRPPRLCLVVTSPLSVRLLRRQVRHFVDAGYQVTVVSAPGPEHLRLCEEEGATPFQVPMVRDISPLADLRALVHLWWLFERSRPDIVNAGTPKAGLLGMAASWLARVPVRIYTLRGLRLETASGFRRRVLSVTERIASRAAQRVICVSPSLRERYLRGRFCSPAKACVLGFGSSNGVEFERFAASPPNEKLDQLRRGLGLPQGAPVVGFVGRITSDKGAGDLVRSMEQVRIDFPAAHLLLVGCLEKGDPVSSECEERLLSDEKSHVTGFVDDAAPYYHLMDVLILPSYREGFPNVPLEAGAAGVPVVAYSTTGCVDAVVHEETGTLVPPGDIPALTEAIVRYLGMPSLRAKQGEAAKRRVDRYFRGPVVWQALEAEYRRLLTLRVGQHVHPAALS